MKNLMLLLVISTLCISCASKELTKNKAIIICEAYIKSHQEGHPGFNVYVPSTSGEKENFSTKTFIAIDKIFEDYGWPPEKYKQLEKQGLIISTQINDYSLIQRAYKVSLTDKGREYIVENSTFQSSNGPIEQLIFNGYDILCDEAEISSNAKEKIAEAEMIFKISNISPIQEVFNKPKEMQTRIKVNFKLFDTGWKIVEDDYAKKLLKFSYVDNPIHWLGN